VRGSTCCPPRPAGWQAWVTVVAIGCAAFAAPGPLAAQQPIQVRLEVRLAQDTARNGSRPPIVRSDRLLAEDRWLTSLRSGLPIRLHYRVEVWRSRGGWFDLFQRQAEWDVIVRHEPLFDQFTLLTVSGGRAQERRYATLDALSAALAFAYLVSVQPRSPGTYYYAAVLEVSTLSDSDVDELQRFLEGDLGEVARGKESIGDALGRGATRFLLRLAGLPSLRLEARSPEFRVR
jgi:hypothetical protein